MGNFNSIGYLDATCDLSLLNKEIKLYQMGFIFIQTMRYYSTHIFFLLGKFFKREQPKLKNINISCYHYPENLQELEHLIFSLTYCMYFLNNEKKLSLN